MRQNWNWKMGLCVFSVYFYKKNLIISRVGTNLGKRWEGRRAPLREWEGRAANCQPGRGEGNPGEAESNQDLEVHFWWPGFQVITGGWYLLLNVRGTVSGLEIANGYAWNRPSSKKGEVADEYVPDSQAFAARTSHVLCQSCGIH